MARRPAYWIRFSVPGLEGTRPRRCVSIHGAKPRSAKYPLAPATFASHSLDAFSSQSFCDAFSGRKVTVLLRLNQIKHIASEHTGVTFHYAFFKVYGAGRHRVLMHRAFDLSP